MGIFTQKQTHKVPGQVKATKYTNKKTGTSKVIIEKLRPSKPRKNKK